jgi:predicted ATPase/class 3 adenylate cyclase/DNA-binding CsgD family transcriptional regulator
MSLPTGTLTFLFTDLEGSTQLWEQQADAMRAALARHDSLLRSAVEDHGGIMVKTTGDGLLAVFHAGVDAVVAALAIQHVIGAEAWNQAIGRLQVRIGLLTGAAEVRDGDYYGPAVNRAARLTAAAHGGQILLSKTTQELVRDELPAGVETLDLGQYRLKGVVRPERLYQLTAAELPADFPPPLAAPVQRTNLPRPRTPFVGRQQELGAVLDLLRSPEARLVTLIGQGGAGKTRLSLEIAATILPEFGDGAFFVDLAPITGPDLVPSAVADVLGILEAGGYSLSELIQRHLEHRQLLLVLDNLEHLLPAADLLPEWLAASPGLTLLVTSREALNLMEEWLYPVGGLPYPEDETAGKLEEFGAIQLFVQSAHRARPDFNLDDEAEGVVGICRLVEGLPLAIELAASWIRNMDARSIAGEIQRNADFLATRLRNVPERHRSMLAAFEYSWQQLAPQEKMVFARLSIFRGGFDRAAAQAVAGATLPALSALVDKSLLRWAQDGDQGQGGRYHVHELLRQFGLDKLAGEPGQAEDIRSKHGLYFINFVRDLLPLMLDERQLEFTARITAEIENIRVAWLWATETADSAALNSVGYAMADYYQFIGHYIEGQAAFLRAVEALTAAELTPQVEKALAGIWLDLAYFHIRLGFLVEAQVVSEKSMEVFHRYGIRPLPGLGTDPRIALGILASIEGDYEATATYGKAVLQTSEADGHTGNGPFGAYLLTRAALAQGDYEAARRHAHEGYAVARKSGERWFKAYLLIELGNIELSLANYAAARDHYEAAYAIRQEFNDPEGAALATVQLGNVALREQQYANAEERFRLSLDIYEEINDRGGLARSLAGLGQTAVANGQLRKACDHYQKALAIAVDIHYVPVMLSLLGAVGEFFLELGELETGLKLLSRAASHPKGEHETRERAGQILTLHRTKTPADRFQTAVEAGASTDLLALAISAQADLLRLEREVEQRSTAAEARAGRAQKEEQPLVEPLTARELEVLDLIAQGMSNQQVADTLIVSTGTVKWYTSQIYGKLGVKSRTQAVAQARALNLLS